MHHFRNAATVPVSFFGIALPVLPDAGVPLQLPLLLGDFYVDQDDETKLWKVLQFGVQNLYDLQQDEWIEMTSFESEPGDVTLPPECIAACK